MASITCGERSLDWPQFLERSMRVASALARAGVTEGGNLAILQRNDIGYLELVYATRVLGACLVPLNWHGRGEELGYILSDCLPAVLVADADLLGPLADAIPRGVRVFARVPTAGVIGAYGLGAADCVVPPGVDEWDALVHPQPPWSGQPRPYRGSMFYTSGTTGRPKGVRLLPMTDSELARSKAVRRTLFGACPGMRMLVTGPLYHASPMGSALAALEEAGSDIVIQPRFDPRETLADIERHRITHLHAVPTMFVRMLKLSDDIRSSYDLSSLQYVLHGAAPCPPEVKRRMIEWWGPVIHEYYSASEGGLATLADSREWLARPGTVGRAAAGAQLRVLDSAGAPCPPGVAGDIYYRSDHLPRFTYHNDEGKRRGIERDGLTTVGDVGYLDEEGYLYLCDRKVDMVISGGVNIYPAEVEAVLHSLAGVADCAVFGIPDEEFGESLAAVILPATGAKLDAALVRDHLAARLAGYKVPRLIEFRDALPREDSGKIFKRRLRDEFWKDSGRRI